MTDMLSREFLAQYEGKHPPFGILGEFVSLRTYSRWLDDRVRRENWAEVCKRVVEYSIGLYGGCADHGALEQEARFMFDSVFNLRVFPSGRTLWIGGTPVSHTNPESNFNCAFNIINDLESFCDTFFMLMVGSGVGFRVLPDDVAQIPRFRRDVEVTHRTYHPVDKKMRKEHTYTTMFGHTMVLVVGDSKEGWRDALREFITAMTVQRPDVHRIDIIYDNVRKKGERLKKFGGWASGHETFRRMLEKMTWVIKDQSQDGNLTTTNVLDMINLIGENVVMGGVRRTSEIGVGHPDDESFIKAKQGINWSDPNDPFRHRRCSNNSIFFEEQPSLARLRTILETIRFNGEPGFINAAAARKRRPWFEGLNPCAEILLADKGVCNLTTVNVCNFVKNGRLDKSALEKAVRLATRIGVRMTNVKLSMKKWNTVQKRDRLTGVSMTGWRDACELMNIDTLSVSAGRIRQEMRVWARDEATVYSNEMRLPQPLLVTTVKPEGTQSCLPTVSSGVHRAFAPYYYRRIEISKSDPLYHTMVELNYPAEDKVTDPDTGIITFPVKTPAKMAAYEESAIDQLENYYAFQTQYTDHNTSCTVYVGDDEWDDVANMLHDNWDDFVAVSFLPKSSGVFPQMPYQQITEDQYNKLARRVKPFDVSVLRSLETSDGSTEPLDSDCAGGACPIR